MNVLPFHPIIFILAVLGIAFVSLLMMMAVIVLAAVFSVKRRDKEDEADSENQSEQQKEWQKEEQWGNETDAARKISASMYRKRPQGWSKHLDFMLLDYISHNTLKLLLLSSGLSLLLLSFSTLLTVHTKNIVLSLLHNFLVNCSHSI